jgi:hypothetical protein
MLQKSVKKRSLQRAKPMDYMDMVPKITKKGIANTAEQVIIWRTSKYWNYIGLRRDCPKQYHRLLTLLLNQNLFGEYLD